MNKWTPLAVAGLSIWTGACANLPFNRSPAPILVQAPRPIPPVECTSDPPARSTFQPPALSPQVTMEQAREALRRERVPEPFLSLRAALAVETSRADRAESVVMPALDHIDADRVADANVDDTARRCAAWSRQNLTGE